MFQAQHTFSSSAACSSCSCLCFRSLFASSARCTGRGRERYTHKHTDTERYDLGDGYGHIALGVQDIQATCAGIADRGGRLVREPGPMKHGSTVIAFLEDPDGYKVELIELPARPLAA